MQALPTTYNNAKTWIDAIPAAERQELEDIKRSFRERRLVTPRRSLARAISAKLKERGLSNIGFPGVEEWLRRA